MSGSKKDKDVLVLDIDEFLNGKEIKVNINDKEKKDNEKNRSK